MSEDVSATMRVGITVILVAALVATVLNLMVMSNSLLSNGQTTLQSGIDSVSQQEFASYDNTKVSGTQVATALSLFQGRDCAIVIQTKAFATSMGADKAVNYGALLTKDGAASSSTNKPVMMVQDAQYLPSACTNYGSKKSDVVDEQAHTAVIITFKENADSGVQLTRPAGAANYVGNLHNTNGLTDSNYDVIGTTRLGNAQYLLSSSRFSSTLIKDPTGSIIGILFRQLQ